MTEDPRELLPIQMTSHEMNVVIALPAIISLGCAEHLDLPEPTGSVGPEHLPGLMYRRAYTTVGGFGYTLSDALRQFIRGALAVKDVRFDPSYVVWRLRPEITSYKNLEDERVEYRVRARFAYLYQYEFKKSEAA